MQTSNKVYIIAPSYNLARHYAAIIRVGYNRVTALCERYDRDKLFGIRDVTITIVNQYACNQELLSYAKVLSTRQHVKLEFKDV